MGETWRLFLGLWPDASTRAALERESARWTWPAAARRTAPERLHLTLHFLGNTPVEQVPALRGVTVVTLFYEASTRTRVSFELAAKHLAADVVNGYDLDTNGNVIGVRSDSVDIGGLHLTDGRASYGFGVQSLMLGFPMHFDWAWRTLLNRDYEDAIFRQCTQTGPTTIECFPTGDFRKMQFAFWIGYDF